MLSSITNHLSVSDAQSVRNLPDDHQYDFVLTLGYYDGRGYGIPDQSDTEDQFVFPDGDHDYSTFKNATDASVEQLDNGNNILVHCQAGVSRSVAVCIAALATYEDLSYEEAYARVQNCQPNMNPTDVVIESCMKYISRNAVQSD